MGANYIQQLTGILFISLLNTILDLTICLLNKSIQLKLANILFMHTMNCIIYDQSDLVLEVFQELAKHGKFNIAWYMIYLMGYQQQINK